MPGAYDTEDFVSQATKKQVTFGFKAIDREQGPKIGHGCGDKVTIITALVFLGSSSFTSLGATHESSMVQRC